MPSSAISSRISHVLRSFWPTGLTLLLVLWLTLAPDPLPEDTPELFPGVDKLVHAVMMGGITGAIIFDIKRTTARQKKIPVRTIVIVCLAVAAFSFADEVAQSLMGIGRSGDVFDFLADCAGIAIARVTAPPLVNWLFRERHGRRP